MNDAFNTLNGLKVRLNLNYCLQYLKTEDDVFAWFISIEAFDSFRGFLSIIGAIVLMFLNVAPLQAGIIMMTLYVFGFIVSQSLTLMTLFNLVYGLIFMFYEKLLRFFIPYIALIAVMFITKNYAVFIAYLVARIIVTILMYALDNIRAKILYSKYDVYIAQVEMTAIKLLKFYSEKPFSVKSWIQDYSQYLKKDLEYIK